ncbi:MAG: nuclear transport factor 2 family protein [Burkholderiaceae bacterium]
MIPAYDPCVSACTALCIGFARAIDANRYDDFVALFAPDGVFVRSGQPFAGHAAIRAFLEARPDGRVTRHLCTNIAIRVVDSENAEGDCSVIMFQGALQRSGPSEASPPPSVVDYRDRFVLTSGGWRFARREVQVIFRS